MLRGSQSDSILFCRVNSKSKYRCCNDKNIAYLIHKPHDLVRQELIIHFGGQGFYLQKNNS